MAQCACERKVRPLRRAGCDILNIGNYYAYIMIAEGQHQPMHYRSGGKITEVFRLVFFRWSDEVLSMASNLIEKLLSEAVQTGGTYAEFVVSEDKVAFICDGGTRRMLDFVKTMRKCRTG